MRLLLKKVESLCRRRNKSISSMLRDAGVSRNAFYALARKKSVVPQSLMRIADSLGVSVSDLLVESYTPTDRMKRVIAETERILSRHADAERDNVRHTLILLDERPIDRLRRALRRGRSFNFR